MSRRLLRCNNRACSTIHGAVIGRLTEDGGIVLDPSVTSTRVYLDTRRAVLSCPSCGADREFRGPAILPSP